MARPTSGRLVAWKLSDYRLALYASHEYVQTNNKINSILDVAIEETGSAQIRDMGKVMAFLKDNYSGQMDFGKVSVMLKDKLKS